MSWDNDLLKPGNKKKYFWNTMMKKKNMIATHWKEREMKTHIQVKWSGYFFSLLEKRWIFHRAESNVHYNVFSTNKWKAWNQWYTKT